MKASIEVKKDVSYKLDGLIRNEIIIVKNIIKKTTQVAGIYLFGSIAKGRYSKNSDIDILILVNEDLDAKLGRRLRHCIEDKIEEVKIKRDVDIKLYSKIRYEELNENPSFEKEILKDLIDIREW